MKRLLPSALVLAFGLSVGGSVLAQVPPADNIPNWPVPATWSPASGGIQTMAEIPYAVPFVAVEPCRIADTRGNGFGGQAGPPALSANVTRVFQIGGAPAGVPAPPNGCSPNSVPTGGLIAASVQLTIVSPSSAGNLIAWAGGTVPQASVINWDAGITALGNGTIVPALNGNILVRLNAAAGQTAHLVIDINGYFTTTLNQGVAFSYTANNSLRAMQVVNLSTTTGNGIEAISAATADGYGAIHGRSSVLSGRHFGVFGEVDSAHIGAGVWGLGPGNGVSIAAHQSAAGVRGEDGGIDFGVLGVAETHSVDTTNGAVVGILQDNNAHTKAAAGWLGRRTCTTVITQTCSNYGGYFDGSQHTLGGITKTGSVAFVEPMAADPTKMIKYISLEGPEAGTYFRGKARFVRGLARIPVPDHFREVTDPESLSIQVQPIGEMATSAVVKIDLDEIVVKGSRNVEFYYTVNGVRRAFRDHEVIQANTEFVPLSADARMPEGVPKEIKRRLVANGLFSEDGSVNMETAERLGLTRGWRGLAKYRAENTAIPD